MNKVRIANIYIDNLSMGECVAKIKDLIKSGSKSYIVTPNVDHIVRLQRDNEFLEAYENAEVVVADGMPIIWASNFLGTPLKEKISGSDLFTELCKVSEEMEYRLFFLGAGEGVAEQAASNLKKKFKNIEIIGVYSPPFGFEKDDKENVKIREMINKRAPDILFVGVGAPKQEKWIYKNLDMLNVKMAIGIGAAFDFAAGTIKRAPVFMQKVGLEWFWRFMHEPRRLFKRYFIDDSRFIVILFKQMWFQKK